MLDIHGFVNTTNACNFFLVTNGAVWTSTGDYCMPGVTRRNVLRLCSRRGAELDLTGHEKNFSVTEVYSADEAFVTGTFAGIAPVTEVDGRVIGTGERGPVVEALQQWYLDLIDQECA